MTQRFGWGHININVADLSASIAFYRKLGFEVFVPAIPYLAINAEQANPLPTPAAEALGLPTRVKARGCIMQLDNGFPKLDLTEVSGAEQRAPLQNKDLGMVRLCLASRDLDADYAYLLSEGVSFLSAPQPCHHRMAHIATCQDPDGTLIELIQLDLDKWRANAD